MESVASIVCGFMQKGDRRVMNEDAMTTAEIVNRFLRVEKACELSRKEVDGYRFCRICGSMSMVLYRRNWCR